MKRTLQKTDTVASWLAGNSAIELAFAQLIQAHNAARRDQRPEQDFAVEMNCLQEAGISPADIRCLVCQGLLEDIAANNRPGTGSRATCEPAGARVPAASRFVLTDKGIEFCRDLADRKTIVPVPTRLPHFHPAPGSNGSCRQLLYNDVVVKEYLQPARSQELILASFQESGWPFHIDDPLPKDGHNVRNRLHNAVYRLNQQIVPVLFFFLDSQGQGVFWKPIT